MTNHTSAPSRTSRKGVKNAVARLRSMSWLSDGTTRKGSCAPPPYSIVDLHEEYPAVWGPKGPDADCAEIVRGNIFRLSRRSKGAYASATLDILNWTGAGVRGDHFIFSADKEETRRLTRTMLTSWDCDVQAVSIHGDQHYKVTSRNGRPWAIGLRLMLLRRMVETAAFLGMRDDSSGALTTDAYNKAVDNGIIAQPAPFSHGKGRRFVGSLFRVVDEERGVGLVYDPEQVFKDVVEAMEALGVPAHALNITLACGSSGRRWSDFIGSTLLDWATGSDFRRGIHTDIKGRKQRNRQIARIDERCRLALAATIDAARARDQQVPSMAIARRMWNGGKPTPKDRAALAGVYLFAGRSGRPPSYSYFRRKWFKPAMVANAVKVWGPSGSRDATFHWLRRAFVHRRLQSIYMRPLTKQQIADALDELRRYMCWETDQIARYAAYYEAERTAREEDRYREARDHGDVQTVDQFAPTTPVETRAMTYFMSQPA